MRASTRVTLPLSLLRLNGYPRRDLSCSILPYWEDALGLDEVYLQAKKYAAGTTVGEGDIRNFAGAIDAANTTKGVFVTTAGFTRSATDYVAKSPKRIVLIDGEELARLMVVHEIGVRTRIRYASQPDRRGLFRRGRPVRRSSCRFSCRRSDSDRTPWRASYSAGSMAASRTTSSAPRVPRTVTSSLQSGFTMSLIRPAGTCTR